MYSAASSSSDYSTASSYASSEPGHVGSSGGSAMTPACSSLSLPSRCSGYGTGNVTPACSTDALPVPSMQHAQEGAGLTPEATPTSAVNHGSLTPSTSNTQTVNQTTDTQAPPTSETQSVNQTIAPPTQTVAITPACSTDTLCPQLSHSRDSLIDDGNGITGCDLDDLGNDLDHDLDDLPPPPPPEELISEPNTGPTQPVVNGLVRDIHPKLRPGPYDLRPSQGHGDPQLSPVEENEISESCDALGLMRSDRRGLLVSLSGSHTQTISQMGLQLQDNYLCIKSIKETSLDHIITDICF